MSDLYIVKAFLDSDNNFGVTSYISEDCESAYRYIKAAITCPQKTWDYYSLYEAGPDQQDDESITYINKLDQPIESWRKESA